MPEVGICLNRELRGNGSRKNLKALVNLGLLRPAKRKNPARLSAAHPPPAFPLRHEDQFSRASPSCHQSASLPSRRPNASSLYRMYIRMEAASPDRELRSHAHPPMYGKTPEREAMATHRCSEWDESKQPVWLTREVFSQQIQARLASIPTSAI
jgi:hypothetical protein